ncbi:MAG: GNAT family N-acetyltransferase [SAR202 cluster bacterium]|nr:GNAT family N-acetyltransferase [SAR202 cluster bacterium]
MLKTIPNIEAYPKTILLRDDTQVEMRPLTNDDKTRLLEFFMRIPEDDRFYLRENVASPEAIHEWTENLRFERVFPIIALAGDTIVADATLHGSRAPARSHVAEIRIVVDPDFRQVGLGGRLMRELLDIAHEMGLYAATMELVEEREISALIAAESIGFRRVATLPNRIKDTWGSYQSLVLLEIELEDHDSWWF